MAKSRSGGGSTSRNVKQVGVRNGASARGITPAHATQIGPALGNRAMEKQTNYRGEPKFTAAPKSVPLGNEVAKNVGGGGPGTGRTVMRSGSQQGLTPAKPMAAGRDILNDFGPDSAGVRERR
jgi:hypothetical protein